MFTEVGLYGVGQCYCVKHLLLACRQLLFALLSSQLLLRYSVCLGLQLVQTAHVRHVVDAEVPCTDVCGTVPCSSEQMCHPCVVILTKCKFRILGGIGQLSLCGYGLSILRVGPSLHKVIQIFRSCCCSP